MKNTTIFAGCLGLILVSSLSAGTFTDSFNNDVPADSDTRTGFWNVDLASGAGSANAAVESGGDLTLTAGDNDGSSDAYSGVSLLTALSSDFNPFVSTQTYSIRGVAFAGSGGMSYDLMRFRFALVSEAAKTYSANDAIIVEADGSCYAIKLTFKKNASDSLGSSAVSVDMRASDNLNYFRGFDLRLGPGTGADELDYHLTLIGDISNVIREGTVNFPVADWNGADGIAALDIWAQEAGGNPTYKNFTVTVGELTVDPIPNRGTMIFIR